MDRIDEIDAKILELLQERGRMKRNAVSDVVGLSVPATSERMRKLEAAGVIQGYAAIVDAKRLQYDITAFIRVNVDGSEHYPAFVEAVTPMDEVLEAHSITGDGSHILKVRTRNTTTLERLLARLQALPGVGGTSSSIVLSTFKETRTVATEPMELFTYDNAELPAP
jgi:Lrp/AsnC family transcriptional regulator, leucine-responsive regulatory protein